MDYIILENKIWNLDEIVSIWKNSSPIQLSESLINTIKISRAKLEKKLSSSSEAIYGINTGFGSLCNTVINKEELDQLQINLVRSHACGTGEAISEELCKLILLLKIISLSHGYSCVRLELVQFLIELYNNNIYPHIPKYGSLGASGDLAPLAHLSLLTIGEGKILGQHNIHPKSFLESKGIRIPMLKEKEGLALLNGTQYSLAWLLDACVRSKQLYHLFNFTAALSMESFNCSGDFLNEEIHRIRRQVGQIHSANEILKFRYKEIHEIREKSSVQDPYSFRCVPQVHGASFDSIQYISTIVEREINSVSDNPIMISDGQIISGGNFHAQPLAITADLLSIAASELGNISERRIYQLIHGNRGLPEFLTQDPGLNSGYMIVQYSAAALVSLNKQMCTPSSTDSIVTSKGQEDHVSMAANAAIKCNEIVSRVEQILVMEWMTACRAWNWRNTWKLNHTLQSTVDRYRKLIPFQSEDHIPSEEYSKTKEFLLSLRLNEA